MLACLADGSRVLKNSLLPRLLKKLQMQGGARGAGTHQRWVGGVLGPYVAAPRERRVPIRRMGVRRWTFFSSLLGGRDMRGVLIRSEVLLLLLAVVLSLAWGVMVVL